jgi:hypothetical protein
MAKVGKSKVMVYAPPTTGFPYLAVLFWRDGSVLRAEPCSSIEEGEKMIAAIVKGFEQIASAAALHRKQRRRH